RDAHQGSGSRRRDRRARLRQGRRGRVGRAQGAVRARAAPLRPHVAPARREPPLRLLGAPHAPGGAVALRGQEGDHAPAHRAARRFPAVFHQPARYARTTIVTLVEGERFRTRGKVTLEAGWRGVYGVEADADKPQEEEGEGGELPAVEKGQLVRCAAAASEAKEAEP